MDAITAVAFLGLVLVVVGILLFVDSYLPPKTAGSRKAAIWMIAVGLVLWLADFLFVLWLVTQIAAIGE